MQNFKKRFVNLVLVAFGLAVAMSILLGSSIMFHYSTSVCVHSFGRKDGGSFCHTYTLAGAHIHAHSH